MEFESVYRENFDRVWRTLRRLGIPEKDVLDVAQEVFVVVVRRLCEFDGRAAFPTWLYGITVRVASDRRRRAHLRREVFGDEVVLSDHRPGPAELLEQKRRVALLERALAEMSFEQRSVFTLFELEGLSGDQIGEALAIPPGTVRSRLRLAREAFARSIARIEAGAQVCSVGGGQ